MISDSHIRVMILSVKCRSEKFNIGVCLAHIIVIDKPIFFDINIIAEVVKGSNVFELILN